MPEIENVSPLSIMEMVARSSMMAKAVLILLVVFSVVSWAIILTKWFLYRRAQNEDKKFLEIFSKSSSLTNIYNACRELKDSPAARVFLTGYHELYLFQEMAKEERSPDDPPVDTLTDLDLKGIELGLKKAVSREIERLSGKLDFLATTGSTTPFIGLFGTVWGIMHSFRVIGVKGSASIGGVAPGIAEALVATAAGLVAAIPAVIFYNFLNNRVRIFANTMDDFSKDFLYMAEKNFAEPRMPRLSGTEVSLDG